MTEKRKPCIYCGTTVDMPLEEAVARLYRCNNCKSDIGLKGQWSGDGWAMIRALADKHGREAVIVEWEKHGPKPDKSKKGKGK